MNSINDIGNIDSPLVGEIATSKQYIRSRFNPKFQPLPDWYFVDNSERRTGDMSDKIIQFPTKIITLDEIFQDLMEIGEVVETDQGKEQTRPVTCPHCGKTFTATFEARDSLGLSSSNR